ncbi:LacI family DNA-binding transcriptional regulator [Glycomyces salinus]|uniref:LacI family DNA-binding transcriptional regulator n=1 Tax=Glycomyces salinus TaxID=980294 RepID=UPI0018EC812C|nr:LacI family DNA-binding transcriptional regulator [Glycomyces salinus]
MARIKDVAARAGVSVATVSRVINDNPRVSGENRARVVEAMTQLRYVPNAVARSLRTDATKTIGLIIGDILNPFFTALARSVEQAAREAGYTVVIGNANERAEEQDHYVRTFAEQQVDAFLICPTAEVTPSITELAVDGRPLAFLDRTLPGLAVPTVRVDGARAIDGLVAHLARLGHRRIGYISGPDSLSSGRDRTEAFLAAMRRHGMEIRPEYVETGDFQAESGRASTVRLLSLPEPPQVIFAGDNLMALGALDEIRGRDLRLGRDVGLASYDDVPWFVHVDPPITAIAQPTEELGHRAVAVLLDLLDGREPESTTLHAQFIPRKSCGEEGEIA